MWSTIRLRDRVVRTIGRTGWTRSARAHRASEIVALVGKGAQLRGTLQYVGTVRIDGQVQGEIQAQGLLVVGEGAVVNATIDAESLVSQGSLTGDIVARESVRLAAPTVLAGSVQAPLLTVEDGVRFQGDCRLMQTRAGILSHAKAARTQPTKAGKL